MYPFWRKVFSGCINFAAKVFCEYTHLENEKFSEDAPVLSVHGISLNSSPKFPNNNKKKKKNTFLSLICRLRRRQKGGGGVIGGVRRLFLLVHKGERSQTNPQKNWGVWWHTLRFILLLHHRSQEKSTNSLSRKKVCFFFFFVTKTRLPGIKVGYKRLVFPFTVLYNWWTAVVGLSSQ